MPGTGTQLEVTNMKKSIACILALAATVALSTAASAERYQRGSGAPPPRHAEFGEPYFFGHVGIFEPNGDSDGLAGFDSGWNVDVGMGSRVNENIAIEATLSRFQADGPGTSDVAVTPLTFGARLILPQPILEPYVGLGIGFYHVNLDHPTFGGDSDTNFGGYLSVGADAWLNPKVALNFEGKYNMVETTYFGNDVNAGGWTVNLGVRVGF
jgi:opacity protein-like surface antigen